MTSSKRRKHLYLYAYRIHCWLAAFNVKWYPGAVTGGKHWKCLLLKYLYFLGPKGPLCLFSLMHISIIVTSSKQRNAAAASLLFSFLPSLACFSHRLWKQQPQGVFVSHEPLGQKARGHAMRMYWEVLWGKNNIDKCKADWIELAHLGF